MTFLGHVKVRSAILINVISVPCWHVNLTLVEKVYEYTKGEHQGVSNYTKNLKKFGAIGHSLVFSFGVLVHLFH